MCRRRAFCEYTDSQPKIPHWFALDLDRTPFAFAGIWRPWTGTRATRAAPEDGEHLLFSFLTTEPNEVVLPVHSKAMPVILTGAACDVWLEADAAEALKLQWPWPADRCRSSPEVSDKMPGQRRRRERCYDRCENRAQPAG